MALAALKAYFKGRNFRNFPKFWTFSLKFITSNTVIYKFTKAFSREIPIK